MLKNPTPLDKFQEVKTAYAQRFKGDPLYLRAPGRINLAGEHLDYNQGFALPATINKEIFFAISLNDTPDKIRLYSVDFDEYFEADIFNLKPHPEHWATYILGVVNELQKRSGKPLSGIDCAFGGTLPQGAGLSSSAALECGIAYGLNKLFALNINKLQLALLCLKAENDFAGVQCGILDMFACFFGKKNHVIYFDCKTLEYRYIPFDFNDYSILLFNTNIPHALSVTDEFNNRVASCQAGVKALKEINPEITCLRDASISELQSLSNTLSETNFNRCLYMVEEKDRYHDYILALKNQDIAAFAALLFETHDGLKNLYGISCPELDSLIDYAIESHEILGGKMMGGGYGGCTVNIVKTNAIDAIRQDIVPYYKEKTGFDLLVYEVELVDGLSEIDG